MSSALHLALELDRRIYRGADPTQRLLNSDPRADSTAGCWMRSKATFPTQAEFEVRQLPIRELRAGMVIEDDVLSKDGNLLILKGGTILTEIWIERLENFAKTRGTQELVGVRIPGLA